MIIITINISLFFLMIKNKRLKVKIIKYKNKIFFIFKRYQVGNQKSDFKIRYFRINYNEEYKDYDFDYHRADQILS